MIPSIEFMIVAGLVVVLIVAIILNMALVLKSNKHIVEIALVDRRRFAQRWDGKKAQDKEVKALRQELAALRAAARQQAREAGGEQVFEALEEDRRRQELIDSVTEDDVGTGGRRISRGLA